MSQTQLSEFTKELEKMTPEEVANVKMLMEYEIRFWKQKAWRLEQQRDRAVEALAISDSKLEKFQGISDEMIECLLGEKKRDELKTLKAKAKDMMNISLWIQSCRSEEGIAENEEKIRFWKSIIEKQGGDTSTE